MKTVTYDDTKYRLVPVEPTSEMRKAATDAWLDCGSRMILDKGMAALRAGIAAAPTPPAADRPDYAIAATICRSMGANTFAECFEKAADAQAQQDADRSGPEAYCEACQGVGMRNCSDFVNCGNSRCITCKQYLPTPAQQDADKVDAP